MTDKTRRIAVATLLATIAIEVVTCVLRFGFHRRSTRDTSFLAPFTFGLRIHHGYIGAVVLMVCCFVKASWIRDVLIVAGVSLVLSDAIHHFLVLWPIVGSPQFDLFFR